MADNGEGEETPTHGNEWEASKTSENEAQEVTPRGNDWEVVSLTASAYAAAPGPRGDESIYEGSTVSGNDEPETSRTLFMSGHFVFPPSQHENLPIEPDKIDSSTGVEEDDFVSDVDSQKAVISVEKVVDNWRTEKLEGSEEFPDIPLFDEKCRRTLSSHVPGFDEPHAMHGLNVDDKGQDFYGTGTGKFSSFHNGAGIGGSATCDEITIINDLVQASEHGEDPSFVISEAPNPGKEEDDDDTTLPCGAWWKRGVASLCAQAKETSTFWSIFVAAAVMGLVVLGQRWQQERWQVLHQRWQDSIGDEKSGRILSRLKDVIVGGSRPGTYLTATSSEL